MCFSASASFAAGAVLGVAGVVAVSRAAPGPQRIFGAIPLLFAVQQCTEGMLWLSLQDLLLHSWQPLFTYVFLIFAMAVWPFWIPFSIWKMEQDPVRKKRIQYFVWTGALVAAGVILVLFSFPVEAVTPYCPTCPAPGSPALLHHLHYEFAIPALVKNLVAAFSILYIAATIVTPFLSGIRKMKWLGLVFLASYIFAVVFYRGFVISVWCFFAALLSFVVLWIIVDENKSKAGGAIRPGSITGEP